MREDLKLVHYAVKMGFLVNRGADEIQCSGDSYTFTKGNKVIWLCRKGWACADLVDGYSTGHRYYLTLTEALNKEA